MDLGKLKIWPKHDSKCLHYIRKTLRKEKTACHQAKQKRYQLMGNTWFYRYCLSAQQGIPFLTFSWDKTPIHQIITGNRRIFASICYLTYSGYKASLDQREFPKVVKQDTAQLRGKESSSDAEGQSHKSNMIDSSQATHPYWFRHMTDKLYLTCKNIIISIQLPV